MSGDSTQACFFKNTPFCAASLNSAVRNTTCFFVEAIASRLETIASWLETIASRLEAIALRLEAIASRLEAIALRLEAIAVRFPSPLLVMCWRSGFHAGQRLRCEDLSAK